MPARNKIIFAGETLIDLTADTVAPETLAAGITAHDRSGAAIVGTMQSGGGSSLPDAVCAGECAVAGVTHVSIAQTEKVTGHRIEILLDGVYRIYVSGAMGCATSSSSYWTGEIAILRNGEAVYSESLSKTMLQPQFVVTADVECTAGDIITVLARGNDSAMSNRMSYVNVLNVTAAVEWDNGIAKAGFEA